MYIRSLYSNLFCFFAIPFRFDLENHGLVEPHVYFTEFIFKFIVFLHTFKN